MIHSGDFSFVVAIIKYILLTLGGLQGLQRPKVLLNELHGKVHIAACNISFSTAWTHVLGRFGGEECKWMNVLSL